MSGSIRQEGAERRNERLEEFASVVSHDLRNPLNVATVRLEAAREERDGVHLRKAEESLDRMESILEETLTLARSGRIIDETEPVALPDIVADSWGNVATGGADLRVEGQTAVEADPDRLRHLFENLFRNSVEHSSTSPRSDPPEDAVERDGDLTVEVGALEDGFYVEDDGVGIPPGEREEVFEAGHSTAEDGTGFGLAIVERIAEAHGWEVAVVEGTGGGARFEFRGVDVPETERQVPA